MRPIHVSFFLGIWAATIGYAISHTDWKPLLTGTFTTIIMLIVSKVMSGKWVRDD